MDDLQRNLKRNLSNLAMWFEENKLSIHLGKTEIVLLGGIIELSKTACMNIRVNNTDTAEMSDVKPSYNNRSNLSGLSMSSSVLKMNVCLKFMYHKKLFFDLLGNVSYYVLLFHNFF